MREVSADVVADFAGRKPVHSPRAAAPIVAPRLGAEEVEVFAVILLDAQFRVIAMQEVTRGLINSSLVHPREVFRLAIAMSAAAIIVAHNHPSGVLTPSEEDKAVTSQLIAAGNVVGIPVHDHIIVGLDPAKYLSFAEAGLL